MNIEELFTNLPDIMHTDDIAKLLRVSKAGVRRRIKEEGLKASRVNNHYHYTKSDVIAYLKGLNESI